jgi:CRISPR-associated protein Csx17
VTVFVHELKGCAPVPLAHYLKGLGILRLVSEQRDPSARGAWKDEAFVLSTTLSATELERFFLDSYEPTPFVAPWNKGSGFFIANDPGLGPVERSKAARFAPFRAGIDDARKLGVEIGKADAAIRALKDQTKARAGMSALEKAQARALKSNPDFKARLAEAERQYKALKESIIPACRLAWRGKHLAWMEAAVVLSSDGSPKYPALLGTGGNDGRLDFTNNAMQRIGDLFELDSGSGAARPAAAGTLTAALWGAASMGHTSVSIGQYLPGGAGGANSSAGPSGDSSVNPWDFLLMMEGVVLFSSLATKRLGAGQQVQASAPFAVRSHAGGYASSSDSDESARGEQWMPLWARPLSLGELRQLLSEGRAQVSGAPAQRALDLARAVARLGTAISSAMVNRTLPCRWGGSPCADTLARGWSMTSQTGPRDCSGRRAERTQPRGSSVESEGCPMRSSTL